MMKTLIFATQNEHKVKEIGNLLGSNYEVKTLAALHHSEDLAEDFEALEENAQQKATFIYEKYGADCFSEDTGLEVFALGGKPGVHTAHYSGSRDATANMNLVLAQLEGSENRAAQFRTVIHLIIDGKHHQFEGIVTGKIASTPSNGLNGFGYDPIFIPDGYEQTFADLDITIKKQISHRAKAVAQLIDFLKK